jgi:subtilisin family serine protease
MLANLQRRTIASLLLLLLAVSAPLAFVQTTSIQAPVPVGLLPFRDACETKSEAATARYQAYREADRLQQLRFLGVDHWCDAGYRGRGIKVAVLDSGFRGYRQYLGSILPAEVVTHSLRQDHNLEARSSQHGILCGEVLHALAPDAELLFANWDPDRPDEFLDAVRWAIRQGARVLSCSLIMPSWSDGEGGGPVHAELNRLIGDGSRDSDPIFFASAGNTAERHWSGAFHRAADGFHEWQPGHEENDLAPWGREEVSVELCCPKRSRFEITIDDETTGVEVTHSASSDRGQGCFAIARFIPELAHGYGVRVRALGNAPPAFHVVALGGSLRYVTASGSVPFPADGPCVLAVGAVDESGRRTPYSSCGPNSSRPKPDLVARVPFASFTRWQPFSGTSAAAPQAAALAALWWSRYPAWTAAQIRQALIQNARDLGPKGHDFETGYGLIHLP